MHAVIFYSYTSVIVVGARICFALTVKSTSIGIKRDGPESVILSIWKTQTVLRRHF